MRPVSFLGMALFLWLAPATQTTGSGPGACREIEDVSFSGIFGDGVLGRRQYFSSALQFVDSGDVTLPSFTTRIIVFGGRNAGQTLNDTVLVDPGTGTAQTVFPSGQVPSGRWGHTAHWTGAGATTPATWPTQYSTSGRLEQGFGQIFTHQGHDFRGEPASASGNFLYENSGPGPCVGGITTHVLRGGGECADAPTGCSCVTLNVLSKNSGSPDSDTVVTDPTDPHYPSLWSGWRIQVTSGPGAGYDGILSWNQGNSYNIIPEIRVQVGGASTFLVNDRSDIRVTSIQQDSMWTFGGRLADGTLSNDMYVLNTRSDGLTAGSGSDLKVYPTEDFSLGRLGWGSDVETSVCGRFGHILGGVGQLGVHAAASKTYVVKNPHTSVRIEMDFIKIDSWDNEEVSLYADGSLLWSRGLMRQSSGIDPDECGLPSMGEELVHINVTWEHSAPTLKLALNVSATADSSPDLWWGIQNVVVTTLPEGVSWRLVTPSGDVPAPRTHHASAAFQDSIFVHGGSTAEQIPAWDDDASSFWEPSWSNGTILSDCFLFNTSSETWSRVGGGPGPRSHHTMVLGLADSIIMYGGQGPDGWLMEDLNILAARSIEWIHPPVVGPSPGRLAAHAAAVDRERMWVFGGFQMNTFSRNVRLQDSLYSLYLPALVWQSHTPTTAQHTLHPWPRRRYGHALAETLHSGVILLGGAFTGDGDGLETFGDGVRLEESCVNATEALRKRQEALRQGELLMACDSMQELDYVEEEARRLEVKAAAELEELELKLTASYLAAAKRKEQYETDRAWFETGVQKYTDLVAQKVAEGRVYTNNVADLAQARRNRLELEETFVTRMQDLESTKLGLHMQLDQTKDRYSKAIAAIRRQGQVLAKKKAEGAISAGRGHACAINALDLVQCWGRNDIAQATPPTGTRFKVVSAGDHVSCGVRSGDRKVECWGSDSFGKLGRSKKAKGKDALVSAGGQRAQDVSAGGGHVCMLTEEGTVECWGDNRDGQTDVPDGGQGMWLMVSCGTSHSCGIRAKTEDERRKGVGEVVCWGSAVDGRTRAVRGRAKWVSAGGKHACAVMEDSKVACWGRGLEGQTVAPTSEHFSTVSAGEEHSCGMLANGGVRCWGANKGGESRPPNRRVKSVSAGEGLSCAIDALHHRVICWGSRKQTRAEVVTCSRVWVT